MPIMGAGADRGRAARRVVRWAAAATTRHLSASVALEVLAVYFIAEGAAEGVAGDVAFIQSIVETGWFRFGGVIPPSASNFAGLGAPRLRIRRRRPFPMPTPVCARRSSTFGPMPIR